MSSSSVISDTGSPADVALPPAPDSDVGDVQVLYTADTTRVMLSGRIDAEMQDELTEAAAAALIGMPVEVDAGHVTFLGAPGVAFLSRLSRATGQRATLIRSSPTVQALWQRLRVQ